MRHLHYLAIRNFKGFGDRTHIELDHPAVLVGPNNRFRRETEEVLDELVLERVFDGRERDFRTWKGLEPEPARLLWEARTMRIKLSDFAEQFFRRLADRTHLPEPLEPLLQVFDHAVRHTGRRGEILPVVQ